MSNCRRPEDDQSKWMHFCLRVFKCNKQKALIIKDSPRVENIRHLVHVLPRAGNITQRGDENNLFRCEEAGEEDLDGDERGKKQVLRALRAFRWTGSSI